MRCHQVSILKIPILWSLQRPDNKLSEEEAKFICLTVGVRKFFGKFLLGKETFEVEQSLPHQQANQEVPSSSVVRHGYPLFLSSLHLLQDLQLLCQAQLVCEEKGDCQSEARLWTRTLVCNGLDALLLSFSMPPGFLSVYLCTKYFKIFPILSKLPLPRV